MELLCEAGFRVGFSAADRAADEPLAYGHHPICYELTSRGAGVLVESEQAAFALSPPTATLTLTGDRPVLCLIRPEIRRPDEFWKTAASLARRLEATLVVKSVSPAQAEIAAEMAGARPYSAGEGWADEARWDDQTFPEVVLDLKPDSWRRESDDRRVEFESVDPTTAGPEFREISLRWMDWFEQRRPEFSRVAVQRYYEAMLSDGVLSQVDYGFLVRFGGRPAGFAVISEVSDFQVDLWTCLTLEEPAKLAQFFYSYLRENLRAKGYLWMGLGGSEHRSLFHFKRCLGPRRTLKRTHLVVPPG